ncbi:MAG TPA: AAA family ATPase [Trueperaceae bacterium]
MNFETESTLDVAYVEEVVRRLTAARREVGKIVKGQEQVVEQLVLALIANGHALIEGAPGLGKTLLARTMGNVFGLITKRIQFTPDLMPADITGTNVLVHDEAAGMHTRFEQGPVFTQLLLADEINRATPKTQSALLEAMQERTVTVAGIERELPRPFMVMATQNPIEMEGTYVLPEAQIDRFFLKIVVEFPTEAVLDEVLRSTTGPETGQLERQFEAADVPALTQLVRAMPVAQDLRLRVARFTAATHPDRSRYEEVKRHVRFGISPRGAQSWLLAAKAHALLQGRFATDVKDLDAMLLPALRHRVQLSFASENEGITVSDVLRTVFKGEVARAR